MKGIQLATSLARTTSVFALAACIVSPGLLPSYVNAIIAPRFVNRLERSRVLLGF